MMYMFLYITYTNEYIIRWEMITIVAIDDTGELYPEIDECIDEIIPVILHIYTYLRPQIKLDLKEKDIEELKRWVINRYSKYYTIDFSWISDYPPMVMVLSVVGLSINIKNDYRYHGYPFDASSIINDIDDIMSHDYYNCNNTIIYNNDIFEPALSIYQVPFDCMSISYYEIRSKIDSLLSK